MPAQMLFSTGHTTRNATHFGTPGASVELDIDFARTIGRSYTRYQYVDLNMSFSLPTFIFFGKIQGSFPHVAS